MRKKKNASNEELGESDDLTFSEEKSEDIEAVIASTEEETSRKKRKGSRRLPSLTKKQMIIWAAIAFACVALAVGLSFGLTINKGNGSENAHSPPIIIEPEPIDNKPKSNDPVDTNSIDNNSVENKPNDKNPIDNGSVNNKLPVNETTDVMPVDNDPFENDPFDNMPVDSKPDENIPTDVEPGKPVENKPANNSTEQEESPPVLTEAVEFAASISDGIINSAPSQPLKFTMRAFGPKSVDTYKDCKTFESDLYNMASIILSNAIEKESKIEVNWKDPQLPQEITADMSITGSQNANTKLKNDAISPKLSSSDDSYGTNNQVKGVDEADVVKSNGKHVFTVYGDEIVVWDAKSGEVLSRTGLTQSSEEYRDLMITEDYYLGQQKSKVETLLLHEDRLTAIVTLYDGYYKDYYYEVSDTLSSGNQKLVQVRVYDIANIPTDGSMLDLVTAQDLKGEFIEARSIEEYAHIITTSHINIYAHLTEHVDRLRGDFYGLNGKDYLAKVQKYLEDQQIIENFIESTRYLVSIDDQCDHIAHLSLFQQSDSSNATIPGDAWISGIMSAYTEITTLDMKAAIHDGNDSSRQLSMHTSVTGAFLPNSQQSHIYASKNYLVFAIPGYSFSKSWDEYTYLMTFALSDDGTRAKGHSVGHVPGFVLNQFSIDEWDGHLRVATTVRSKFDCVHRPTSIPGNEDSNLSPTITKIGCNWEMVQDSDNMITILDIPTSSNDTDLIVVSSIKGLGHEGEQIYAVRFMKEKAFMVTFRQTDPFYTFDLSDPSDPKQLGELKISGFSNYLHPFDSEANFIIAVGQEADSDTGRPTGLQISLYNVTDLSDPNRVSKHDVTSQVSGGSSYSEAQFEHKAFRFFKNKQKLIIPAVLKDENYVSLFDGFKVFSISTEGIIFDFDIDHNIRFSCWSDSYLSERSLIHDGILSTMKGHVIKAYDIETKDSKWETNLDIDNTKCVDRHLN